MDHWWLGSPICSESLAIICQLQRFLLVVTKKQWFRINHWWIIGGLQQNLLYQLIVWHPTTHWLDQWILTCLYLHPLGVWGVPLKQNKTLWYYTYCWSMVQGYCYWSIGGVRRTWTKSRIFKRRSGEKKKQDQPTNPNAVTSRKHFCETNYFKQCCTFSPVTVPV